MHYHTWRQEPLHNIIGQPNEKHPEVALLCGHVDYEAREVCIQDEELHQLFDPLDALPKTDGLTTDKGKNSP